MPGDSSMAVWQTVQMGSCVVVIRTKMALDSSSMAFLLSSNPTPLLALDQFYHKLCSLLIKLLSSTCRTMSDDCSLIRQKRHGSSHSLGMRGVGKVR